MNLLLEDKVLTSTPLNCTTAITKVQYHTTRKLRARKNNLEKKKYAEEAELEDYLNENGDQQNNKKKENPKQKKIFEEEWVEENLVNVDHKEILKRYLKAKYTNVKKKKKHFFLNQIIKIINVER